MCIHMVCSKIIYHTVPSHAASPLYHKKKKWTENLIVWNLCLFSWRSMKLMRICRTKRRISASSINVADKSLSRKELGRAVSMLLHWKPVETCRFNRELLYQSILSSLSAMHSIIMTVRVAKILLKQPSHIVPNFFFKVLICLDLICITEIQLVQVKMALDDLQFSMWDTRGRHSKLQKYNQCLLLTLVQF